MKRIVDIGQAAIGIIGVLGILTCIGAMVLAVVGVAGVGASAARPLPSWSFCCKQDR